MPSLTITAEESAIFSEYLSVGGRLQPRYEYTRHQGNKEDLSSFYLRRARIDFRGEMFGEKLTFRIMPELAREATMRDAWLNYEFSNAIQIRAGQMPVPYQWHRFVSSTRQYFAERSIISESFGVPGGYDIGIMLHRKDQANIIQLEAGFFDGSGRNTKLSNSNGNLASGRMSLALMGTLPKSEVSLSRTEEPSLAIGTAIQAANKNESRNWSIGRSASANYRSSYLSSGADLYFNYKSISIAGEIHHRLVSPDDEDVENYNGTGYMATAGFVILPGRIDIAGRYSELNADNSDATTKGLSTGNGEPELTFTIRNIRLKRVCNFYVMKLTLLPIIQCNGRERSL